MIPSQVLLARTDACEPNEEMDLSFTFDTLEERLMAAFCWKVAQERGIPTNMCKDVYCIDV